MEIEDLIKSRKERKGKGKGKAIFNDGLQEIRKITSDKGVKRDEKKTYKDNNLEFNKRDVPEEEYPLHRANLDRPISPNKEGFSN